MDPRGEPVIGASVVLLNQSTPTNIGTVTDFDGNWSINIYGKNAENAVVRIQSMGFHPRIIKHQSLLGIVSP